MEVDQKNTVVVMPAYNESRTIGDVVSAITRKGYRVVVINDGSTDDTAGLSALAGAHVISHSPNQGKGRSLREAIKYAAGMPGCEWIIMMDADGQHHPDDIASLSSVAASSGADMVIGNRMDQTKNMPLVRYLTNRFMSWVVSRMCRESIPDSQCGYRLMRARAVNSLRLESDRFDIESEILIEAARKKMIICSAPVKTIYGREVSKIHPLRDTVKFMALVFRFYFFRD